MTQRCSEETKPDPGDCFRLAEAGVEPVLYKRSVRELIEEEDFYRALNYAALLLALLRGGLKP